VEAAVSVRFASTGRRQRIFVERRNASSLLSFGTRSVTRTSIGGRDGRVELEADK
jgi:hypothetical protein